MNGHGRQGASGGSTPGAGLPVAVPLGSPHGTPQGVVTGVSGRSRGTNTPRSSSSPASSSHVPPKGSRIGSRTRARLAMELAERDRLVLARLWEHRYLTTLQLQRFCFVGHASDESAARTTRRVLARLQRDQLVRPLKRRIGGVRAGSEARVWQLAPAGARIAQPETGKAWRTHEPSERFLAHTLAIADTHLTFRSGMERGYEVSVQVEPLSWRRFSGIGGEPRLVRPDLATVVQGIDDEGAFEDGWFVEVDMGTESLPTLLAKCRLYMDYYRAGIEQAEHGSFPRVLWVLHGPRAHQRLKMLTTRILRTPSLEPRLFQLTTPEDLTSLLWNDTPSNPEGQEVL